MYAYLKERIKHAVRFRNKRGFGVHSPFMFNLILNVLRDKDRTYAYPEVAEKKGNIRNKSRKFLRLLYRLACYLDVKSVLCLGIKTDNARLYLSDLPSVPVLMAGTLENMAEADFIYVGSDARILLEGEQGKLLSVCNNKKRCIVITDIYKNGFNARLWQQLKGRANVNVDMMWYGILFFDEKLQKGRYHLII